MTNLERNLRLLWYKGDVSHATWLCISLWQQPDIHIQITKDSVNGAYFIRCQSPVFCITGFDLQVLLERLFVEMPVLFAGYSDHRYEGYKAIFKRSQTFLESLRREPLLFSC